MPIIVIPWLWTIRGTEEFKKWFQPINLLKWGLLGIAVIIIFIIMIWPYSWADPINRLVSLVSYYRSIGLGNNPQQPAGWIGFSGINFYPLMLLLTQTPEIILILAGIAVYFLFKNQQKERWLLLLWVMVPIVRQMVPGVWFYNGLRQEMEALPALAVLSGMGVFYLSQKLKVKRSNRLINSEVVISGLVFVLLMLAIGKYHPNENAYFNMLAGGLPGAVKQNLVDWSLTYGNVYKQGIEWLNMHAETNAKMAHLEGSNFAISPVWLRKDMTYSPVYFSGWQAEGEYLIKPYDSLPAPYYAKKYVENFLNPIYVVKVDGAAILSVYKNSPENQKTKIRQNEITTVREDLKDPESGFARFDLGKEVKVTGIEIAGKKPNCSPGKTSSEIVAFVAESRRDEPIDLGQAYVENEKESREDGSVRYFFPGDLARYIVVKPLNNLSCFANGKITKVQFLE